MKKRINKDGIKGINSDGCGIVLTKFYRKYQAKLIRLNYDLKSFFPVLNEGLSISSIVCKHHEGNALFYHLY